MAGPGSARIKKGSTDMGKMINSVRGPIDIDSLGVTLTHEHLWFDVATLYKRAHPDLVMTDEKVTKENRKEILRDLHSVVFEYEDNLCFNDVGMTVKELESFKAAGGQTIVEVSTADIARNPLKLREIAEKAGINVIKGNPKKLIALIKSNSVRIGILPATYRKPSRISSKTFCFAVPPRVEGNRISSNATITAI